MRTQSKMVLLSTAAALHLLYQSVGYCIFSSLYKISTLCWFLMQINRGQSYSFNGNVSVEACTTPQMSGQFCNQTVDSLSCLDSYNLPKGSSDNQTFLQMAKDVVHCRTMDNETCHEANGAKVFSLDVVGIAEKLIITVSNVSFNLAGSSNNTNKVVLSCYARHGSIPRSTLHDYSGNLSQGPLIIPTPKIGRWYVTVHPVSISSGETGISTRVCYSLEWQVLQCPMGKAGPNCTWERYMLQVRIILLLFPSIFQHEYFLDKLKMFSCRRSSGKILP